VQVARLLLVLGDSDVPPPIDGRHARAARTREAIVDALLSLLEEGELDPSADQIAERAGVSRRVMFNHFADREDLLTHVAERQFQRVVGLKPEFPRQGSRRARAQAFCAAIGGFYEHVAPVRRAAILFAHQSDVISSHMEMALRMHRAEVEAVFAPEIEGAPEEERAFLAKALAAATSFSFWDELRRNQGLSLEETILAMQRFVEGALERPRSQKARQK